MDVIIGDHLDPLDPEAEAQVVFTQLLGGFNRLRESHCPERPHPSRLSSSTSEDDEDDAPTLTDVRSLVSIMERSLTFRTPADMMSYGYHQRPLFKSQSAEGGKALERVWSEPNLRISKAPLRFSASKALPYFTVSTQSNVTGPLASPTPEPPASPSKRRSQGMLPKRSCSFGEKRAPPGPSLCWELLDAVEKLEFFHSKYSEVM